MTAMLLLLLTTALVNNVVLSQFLGLCPFLGVSKQLKTAAGMGAAVMAVVTLASALTWVLYHGVLVPLGLSYMNTIAFILVIAALVQLVEMLLKRFSRPLYAALGVYLPLITTNCAVLGVALQNVQQENGFLTAVVNGFGTSLGFLIAIVVMAGLREKIANNDVPESFKGMPITLLRAGLMAIAFCGFGSLL